MNKKFFAALASATMALSATGSLAVFADEFDTVTEDSNWVPGSDADTTVPEGSVVFNKENFPSKDFRKWLEATRGFKNGQTLKKDDLAGVKEIGNATIPFTATGDLTGIEYFTSLETLYLDNADVTALDLSKNTKLNTVSVVNAAKLNELVLPTTNTLKTLIVKGGSAGRCPLPILDLAGNKGLNTVTVNNTDIAVLDLSNNSFLTDVNVNNNKLNTINLDGALNLKTLRAKDNRLYSISLPDSSTLTTLVLANNKLASLDVTKSPELTSMDIRNNCLNKLDLSESKKLTTLVAYNNNLGALDLSNTNVTGLVYESDSNAYSDTANMVSGTSQVSPQHAFINATDNQTDLSKAFDGFNKKKILKVQNSNINYSSETGMLKFKKDKTAGSYVYNTDSKDAKKYMRVYILQADLMNRLYNPNSGEHFYTKDTNEKDVLVSLGWHDEGIGWVAPESGSPVYRLYNPNAGDHHYTTESRERDALVSAGWKSEGIGWYSPNGPVTYSAKDTGKAAITVNTLELFREYNPNAKAAGSHNYTLNEAENDFLCSIGWIPEGIAWNALK